MFPRNQNKYNAKKTEYGGVLYDSKREAEYAMELDWLKKAGQVLSWERQVPYVMEVNGKKICKYTVDFLVTYKDGTVIAEEVKGMRTAAFNLKWKLFEALYPKLAKKIVV
jgi:hypothetical protein